MTEATQEGRDLAREHGAENVTTLVTMIGGAATNTIGILSTAEDRRRAMTTDPKMQ